MPQKLKAFAGWLSPCCSTAKQLSDHSNETTPRSLHRVWGCTTFRKFLIEGTKPNLKKIKEYVDRSLMLATALAPVIGYDKVSRIEHYAMDNEVITQSSLGAALTVSWQRFVGTMLGTVVGAIVAS